MSDDDDIGWSIRKTSDKTSESVWRVKERLRDGTYKAKKSGRRTIIIPATVRAHWETLPEAKFAPPRQRRSRDSAVA